MCPLSPLYLKHHDRSLAKFCERVRSSTEQVATFTEDCKQGKAQHGYTVYTFMDDLEQHIDVISKYYKKLEDANDPSIQGKCASEQFIRFVWPARRLLLTTSVITRELSKVA